MKTINKLTDNILNELSEDVSALLTEDPDVVKLIDGKRLTGTSKDAVAFMYIDKVLYISNDFETHTDILDKYITQNDADFPTIFLNFGGRTADNCPGRLWKNSKIISLGVYPDKSKFKQLIKDLNKQKDIHIDNTWMIEINKYKVKPSQVKPNGKYDYSGNLIVPINDYIRGDERKMSDKAKQHMLSPLLKTGNTIWKRNRKLSKGMSDAEYNAKKTRYKYTEDIITENPDRMNAEEKELKWNSNDARSFGGYNGYLSVGPDGDTFHSHLRNYLPDEVQDGFTMHTHLYREDYTYAGRLWLKRKVISFWSYPDQSKYVKLMKQLGNHKYVKQNLLGKDGKIEIVPGKDGKPIQYDGDWTNRNKNIILIPTKDYTGSNARTTKELSKLHTLSPLFKKGTINPKALKHMKLPKGMSEVEARYLMTKYKFQESVLKETPDEIKSTSGTPSVNWKTTEAYPFGWSINHGFLWIGQAGSNHDYGDTSGNGKGGLGLKAQYPKKKITRDNYSSSGRMGIKTKIISFGDYPSEKLLPKLIKDLEKNRGIKIGNNGGKIELPTGEGDKPNLIPLEYFGRENEYYEKKGSAKARRKIHLDPELKKLVIGKPVSTKKLPKGMSQAEYNWLRTKYKYQEGFEVSDEELSEIVLNENPDYVTNQASFTDSDGRAFGGLYGELLVGKGRSESHDDLTPDSKDGRVAMAYSGRIGINKKVISFWKYPPINKFNKLMKELGNHKYIKKNILGKDWEVEILPLPNGKPGIFDDIHGNKYGVLIPTKDYAGSSKRTKSELAKLHILSPLFKKGGGGWSKNTKLPKGMSTAEAKYLMTKYKFQEALEISDKELDKFTLIEHPDEVKYKGGILHSGTSETISFGIDGNGLQNGTVWVSKPGKPHDRSYKYGGRIGRKHKVISFGNYPKTKDELGDMLRLVGAKLKIDFEKDKSWQIEIYSKSISGTLGSSGLGDHPDAKLVPLSSFKKSESAPLLKKLAHIKGRREFSSDPAGIKTLKLPKGMTTAEYKWLMTKYKFQESNKLSENQIKNIINDYLFKEDAVGLMDTFLDDLGEGKELLKEVTASPINGTDADDGPATWYVNYRHYSKEVKKVAEKGGMKIIDYLVTGVAKNYKNSDDYGDAIANTFFPAGVPGKATPTSCVDWKGTKAYNAWRKGIKNVALITGFTFVHKIDTEEKKRAIDTTKTIKGTEDGIQGGKETKPLEERVVDELLEIEGLQLK